MPDFIVRLFSQSVIRLGSKPYDDEASRKTVYLGFPFAQIALFDSLTEVAPDVMVRNGLLLQLKIPADNIDTALSASVNIAGYALSLLTCVSMASSNNPIPLWAYDATEGIIERDFRLCFYGGNGPRATRSINDQSLLGLLEKNYDSFLARSDVKDDFKERIQRALMAFRRGIAENDDILNEFLTHWSTMEGLDCVYTKMLPSSTVRNFKDGMKDVLKRLGRQDVFTKLERLRNDIAHGSLSLGQATQTAVDHVELIRKALVTMILRILATDAKDIDRIINQVAYKGKASHHIRLRATIRFNPIDVRDLANQPQVKVWLAGEKFLKKEQTLEYQPDLRVMPLNLEGMDAHGMEYWGDAAMPVRLNGMGVEVIPKEKE